MANEIRIRQGGLGGLVEDNPLTASATLLTTAGLAAVSGGVDSSHHLPVILDPDGIIGPPEIAYVTSLTAGAGATGATGLLRGQEGTTARQHDQDTPWLHGPTPRDYPRRIQKIDLATADASTASAYPTFVDIDATNEPDLSIYGFVGDIFEWTWSGTLQQSGSGNNAYLDALITLPDASTTAFRTVNGTKAAYAKLFATGETGGLFAYVRATYVATQTGVHKFRPQWCQASGTLTLDRHSGSTLWVAPIHLVKNFGPPAD